MEENEKYTQESLTALEAVLFAAAAPVSYARLSETMGLKTGVIHEMCQTLSNDYERRGAGIRMQFQDAQVQLTTAPEASSAVETFLGLVPVVIYGAVYFVEVILIGVQNGGWPDFYSFNKNGNWMLTVVIILAATIAIGFLVRLLHNINIKKQNRVRS